MHLSLLSDGYFSDVVDDSGRCAEAALPQGAAAHRDGLLRGLAVIAVAGVLLGLTVLPGVSRSAEADASCRTTEAAVWWEATPFTRSTERLRSFHASPESGTAVSLVALRQRFRSACR